MISIIVTVYNKEKYLKRCLDSCLNQESVKQNEYEIVAINDGSTDSSLTILNEYASEYSNISVFSQENLGLSEARNCGVKMARGEYVWFVDADDVISPNAVKLISNATISTPDVIPIYAQTEGVNKVRNKVSPSACTGEEILISGNWEQCGVFNVLRKSFVEENGLFFLPGIYHEDAEFTPRMLYAAKSIKVIPEVLYTVYRDPDSITQVPRAKRAFDYLTVAESLSRFVVNKGETGTAIGNAIDGYTAQDINNAFFVISQNSKNEQKKLNDVYYSKREVLNRVLRSAPQLKYKLESCLFSIFPKYYVLIYKVMKSFGR